MSPSTRRRVSRALISSLSRPPHRGRRVLRVAVRQAGVRRDLRGDRATGSIPQMHLLLASQRLDEGRLRGLESHLSYRIGLRTFSAGSRARSSGSRTPMNCPRSPVWATSKPDQTNLISSRPPVSGPPKGRRRASPPPMDAGPRNRSRPFSSYPSMVKQPAAATAAEPVVTGSPEDTRRLRHRREPDEGRGPLRTRSGSHPWTCRTRWTNSSVTSRRTRPWV